MQHTDAFSLFCFCVSKGETCSVLPVLPNDVGEQIWPPDFKNKKNSLYTEPLLSNGYLACVCMMT